MRSRLIAPYAPMAVECKIVRRLLETLQCQVYRASEIGLVQHAIPLAIGIPETASRARLLPCSECACGACKCKRACLRQPVIPLLCSHQHRSLVQSREQQAIVNSWQTSHWDGPHRFWVSLGSPAHSITSNC